MSKPKSILGIDPATNSGLCLIDTKGKVLWHRRVNTKGWGISEHLELLEFIDNPPRPVSVVIEDQWVTVSGRGRPPHNITLVVRSCVMWQAASELVFGCRPHLVMPNIWIPKMTRRHKHIKDTKERIKVVSLLLDQSLELRKDEYDAYLLSRYELLRLKSISGAL